MSSKISKRKITVPIYNAVINLCVVKEMEHMQTYLDKFVLGDMDVTGSDGCVFDLTGSKGREYYIVLVERELSHNLVSHEIFHLAGRITSDIHIVDEESTAWLLGYLSETIYKNLKTMKYKIEK